LQDERHTPQQLSESLLDLACAVEILGIYLQRFDDLDTPHFALKGTESATSALKERDDLEDLYDPRLDPIHGRSPTCLGYEPLRVTTTAPGVGEPLLGGETGGRRQKSPVIYNPIIRLRLQSPECR